MSAVGCLTQGSHPCTSIFIFGNCSLFLKFGHFRETKVPSLKGFLFLVVVGGTRWLEPFWEWSGHNTSTKDLPLWARVLSPSSLL